MAKRNRLQMQRTLTVEEIKQLAQGLYDLNQTLIEKNSQLIAENEALRQENARLKGPGLIIPVRQRYP